jgi:hypothetical protein
MACYSPLKDKCKQPVNTLIPRPYIITKHGNLIRIVAQIKRMPIMVKVRV